MRTIASSTPPTYDRSALPSRSGLRPESGSGSNTTAAPVPTTRNTRAMSASSMASNNKTNGTQPRDFSSQS